MPDLCLPSASVTSWGFVGWLLVDISTSEPQDPWKPKKWASGLSFTGPEPESVLVRVVLPELASVCGSHQQWQ